MAQGGEEAFEPVGSADRLYKQPVEQSFVVAATAEPFVLAFGYCCPVQVASPITPVAPSKVVDTPGSVRISFRLPWISPSTAVARKTFPAPAQRADWMSGLDGQGSR